MVLFVVLVFLLFAFHKEQPLKSRTVGPIICLLSIMINSILSFIFQRLPFAQVTLIYCNVTIFGPFLLLLHSFTIIFLNYLRFMIIVNMNKFKSTFYSTTDDKVKLKFHFRLINKLTSGYGLLFISTISTSLLYGAFIIIGIIFDFNCSNELYSFCLFAFIYLFLLFILILILLVIILDLVINWRLLLTFQWIKFFITDDPLLFRLEKLFYPLFIFSVVIHGLLNLNLGGANLTPPFIGTFVQTIFIHCVLFLYFTLINNDRSIYFVLTVTIVKYLLFNCQQKFGK